MNTEHRLKIHICRTLVDDDYPVMVQELGECCGRINRKRSACDDEQVTLLARLDRSIDILMLKVFLVENNIGTDYAAAFIASGDAFLGSYVFDVELLTAVHAVIAENRTVKFDHALAACFLMKIINILCDNRFKLALLLKPYEGLVGLVGLCIGIYELTLVKIEKDIRIFHEEIMSDYIYRPVSNAGVLIIDTGTAAEIGDAALGGYTGTAQEHYILRFCNQFLKLLDLSVSYASEPVDTSFHLLTLLMSKAGMIDHMIYAGTVEHVKCAGSTEHLFTEDSLLVTFFLNDIGKRASYSVGILYVLDFEDGS